MKEKSVIKEKIRSVETAIKDRLLSVLPGKSGTGKQKKYIRVVEGGEREGAEKLPVVKAGPRKKWIIAFWILLLVSVAFGVYNNFTAVDTKTVVEKEIVEEKLKDTNALESYVKEFAAVYHSWSNTSADISKRENALGAYMTEELVKVNRGTVTTDCPTTASVAEVHIWSLEEADAEEYQVVYSVVQELAEDGATSESENAYQVRVHVDSSGNMVIIKNPTVYAMPGKSSYAPKEKEVDGTVDASTSTEIQEFLNTFFNLYPTSTAKELSYYVKDGVLPAVSKSDYVYAGLDDAVYYKEGEQIKAAVYVKYLNQETKISEIFQYDLVLEKGDNWKIVGVE